jgi:dihydroorotase
MFTRYFRPDGVVGDIGQVMSKFLYLGLSVEQAIEKVTSAPMRTIPLPAALGTLRVGRIADLTVLKVDTGSFQFTDSPRLKQQRTGKQLVQATATIKSGRVYSHRV